MRKIMVCIAFLLASSFLEARESSLNGVVLENTFGVESLNEQEDKYEAEFLDELNYNSADEDFNLYVDSFNADLLGADESFDLQGLGSWIEDVFRFPREGRIGRGGRRGDRNNRGISCTFEDKGWFEEHRNGHGSCKECLRHHGECRKECSENQYVCRAIFIHYYRSGERSYHGKAENRSRAKRRALRKCERRNDLTSGYCSVRNCRNESRIISRDSCRRRRGGRR